MTAAALGGLLIVTLAAGLIGAVVALMVSGVRRRATLPRSARTRVVGGAIMAVVGVLLRVG